jgi:pyruvate/2-oxoglutarate dehydrogenase complex dihydrolipoamide acyltransferase (E2) component
MANTTIVLRKSSTPGAYPSSLANGELALNYADGKLYYKSNTGSILAISGSGGGGSSYSFATINANSSLILATSPTDTLSIIPGNNITITANTTTKSITIDSSAAAGSSGLNWYDFGFVTDTNVITYFDFGSVAS